MQTIREGMAETAFCLDMRSPAIALRFLPPFLLPALLVTSLAPGCASEAPEDRADDEPPTEEMSASALVAGTPTPLRPEIGRLVVNAGACTGTLVTPRLVLTAAHCIRYTTGNISGTFAISTPAGVELYVVDKTFSLGSGGPSSPIIGAGATDVALVRLASAVPSSTATPAEIWPWWPPLGYSQTFFGYGCLSRTMPDSGDFKQYYTIMAGQSSKLLCSGDSGGPVVWHGHTEGGPIFAVASGYDASGFDFFGDASTYGLPGVEAVKRFSDAVVTNVNNPFLAAVASQSGAKILAGDFNGDGLTDLALVGGFGWNTVPVAFSNGSGGFTTTNLANSFLPAVASQSGAMAVAGDFNGDGRDDIALAGVSSWNTIPIAYSNGNGTFTNTNHANSFFATVAAQPGARLVAGKFNSDNRADLALVGGAGWNSIPVAFSNGNGTFSTTNLDNSLFAAVSVQSGAKVVTGDFNGDGRTDLAATGAAGWTTIPVAFSNGDGSFATTNHFVWHFPGWAAQGSKVVAGDFDGDGRADLALTGVVGSIAMTFAFSTGDGNFTAGRLPINHIPTWSAEAPFAVSGRFKPHTAGGDGRRDIALLGNSAWASVPMVSLRN